MALPTIAVPHEPFVSFEHVNLNVAEFSGAFEQFWFEALGCVRDPRAEAVLNRTRASGGSMQGLVWANIGLQQIHMPTGEVEEPSQRLRGSIEIDFPDLSKLKERLTIASVAFIEEDDGSLVFKCPQGNVIKGTKQSIPHLESLTWYGAADILEETSSSEVALPGGSSLGLGIRSVTLHIPAGAAADICTFYQHYFRAAAVLDPASRTCIVSLGYHQSFRYQEVDGPIPEYDGHHVALYINDFVGCYQRIAADGLIFNNPRFPQFRYDTLELALQHNEFRVKDMSVPGNTQHSDTNINTNTSTNTNSQSAACYVLEHEVRSLAHPGFSCRALLQSQPSEEGC